MTPPSSHPEQGKENIKEETWQEFCIAFRRKIKEITDPVAHNSNNRSYNALTDVISNIILFEINIDKKPWEEIPKAKVRLPERKEMLEDAIWMDNNLDIANILLEKIKSDVSYKDNYADNLSPHTIASMGLFSALKTYIKDFENYKRP